MKILDTHLICDISCSTLMSGETPNLLVGQASRLSKPEQLQKVQEDIGEVERMLKALIKSLENKDLKP